MATIDEEMVKTLTSLIDETLEEMEEIKKSKFAASEVSLGDSESGMGSKPKNGELDAKKADDDEDEDKKKKEDKDMDKGENEKADEDAGKFAQAPTVSKGENEKADEDAGKFAQAPTVSKKDDEDDDDDKKDKDMDYKKDMKKSLDQSEDLMKSYVDEKFSTLSESLSKMQEAIEALADQPVERKGIPAGVTALQKSADEAEPLNKADIANKLFELKKSGETVDSTDIFMVETSQDPSAVFEIANKYGLK